MKDVLKKLEQDVIKELTSAKGKEEILEIKTRYLGRKGELALLIKDLSKLPPENRPIMGGIANKIKTNLEERVELLLSGILEQEKSARLMQESVDVSLPGRHLPLGHSHPITQIMDEVKEIFSGMGFIIAEGPAIETDYYNFEALNIPKDHPARDMQDTFYIADCRLQIADLEIQNPRSNIQNQGEVLLRTHTSPVQVRVMEKNKPPFAIVIPGKVYRPDATDASHSFMFHQVEGLVVSDSIKFSDLKGVLTVFAKRMFGEKIKMRFRPSFFPFTEPSAEVDISCILCEGSRSRVQGQGSREEASHSRSCNTGYYYDRKSFGIFKS